MGRIGRTITRLGLPAIAAVLFAAVMGILSLGLGGAATHVITAEAENGTRTGDASLASPAGASGQAVSFGSSSTGRILTVAKSGSGGQYDTIMSAFSAAQPGDTVLISGGTYDEHLNLTKSGTSGKYVTLQGKSGEKVIVTGTGTRGILSLAGRSWLRFINLTLQGSDNFGAYVEGGSNLLFQSLEIDGTQDGGLVLLGVSNVVVDGCNIHGTNAFGLGADHEALSITENSRNFEVKNCQVHDNGEEGIDAKYNADAGGSTIHDNLVWNNRGPNIYIDGANNLKVFNNTVYGAKAEYKAGIAIAAETSYTGSNNPRRTSNIDIFNNVVYGNAGAGIDFWTEPGGSIADVRIFFNTITGNTSGDAINVNTTTLSGSNPVFGNIINGNAGGNGLQLGNNHTGSVTFAGNGDYRLKPDSAGINAAPASGAPAFDRDNKPRPQGAGHDYGAYDQ